MLPALSLSLLSSQSHPSLSVPLFLPPGVDFLTVEVVQSSRRSGVLLELSSVDLLPDEQQMFVCSCSESRQLEEFGLVLTEGRCCPSLTQGYVAKEEG